MSGLPGDDRYMMSKEIIASILSEKEILKISFGDFTRLPLHKPVRFPKSSEPSYRRRNHDQIFRPWWETRALVAGSDGKQIASWGAGKRRAIAALGNGKVGE